ncbi:MAG: sigma 54-interacting transcriptional regulator [Pirellulales bacterium]|nr:sigma 54-interacting transcriptional regulator [Pirellulales bacterium]
MIDANNISEYFKEAVLEIIPCAVFIVNANGQVVFWNRSAEVLTRFTAEETLGGDCMKLYLDLCNTEDPSILEDFCPLRSGSDGGELECTIQRKDGMLVPVIRRSKVVRNGEGKLLGAIETLVDVSLIKRARSEIRTLKRAIAASGRLGELVGSSAQMRKLYEMVLMVADTDANLVIEGETGTGKELAAKTIHAESSRSKQIFLGINCGALPESLLEAELFGHKKGTFTGAVTDRAGCFEAASGGTLFLDEIAEMSFASQVKLLRVLQEGMLTRLGDTLPRSVDVRVIAATNKNLLDQVKMGQFREDLYYRLKVVSLQIPPLRERPEDIPDLVVHFIHHFRKKYKREIMGCSKEAMDILMHCSWPGNIRQLEHAIEHAFIVTGGDNPLIKVASLPREVLEGHTIGRKVEGEHAVAGEASDERSQVQRALSQAGGNKSEAARILGLTRAGLYKKMKRLRL